MPRLARSLALAVILLASVAPVAPAATLAPIGTFSQPIFITSDPVEPDRLFVVERGGTVAEVDGEGAAPHLYADLTGFVACCAGERGLLSIALAPGFHKSGLFYAAYTGKAMEGRPEGDIHVDAFTADADGDVTRSPIIAVGHTPESNHNGGQIQFGPDGYLYISTGDGGGGGDPFESGQSLTSLLGKILRIDPEPGSQPPYSIPPDNPFVGRAGADEIWAYGLRNPWRFSFDSLTGGMAIADVGQNTHEEVDWAPSPAPGHSTAAGLNYGWSCREGFSAYPNDGTPTLNCAGVSNFTEPVFDYPHTDPGGGAAHGCAITGGYVVRDPTLTDLYGRYVYADYCVGEIRSLALPAAGGQVSDDSPAGIATPTPNPVSFGEDSCHRIYVASGSTVYRFEGAVPAVCPDNPEEEPPGDEVPPPIQPEDTKIPNPFTPAPPPTPRPPTVSLEADDFGNGSFRLRVQVLGCSPSDTDSIQLNRGGRHLARKPAGKGCAARFRVHLDGPATFRALFWSDPEAAPVRSRPLRVG